MSDGILLILGHWNTHAEIAGDMEISVAFLEGDEGIELATPTTLEDITLTGRDVECQAWSEDEVIGFIIDHCVLETESKIHPALGIVECCVVDFKIAILVGNECQTVGQSVADLQRIKLSTATTSGEAVVNGVMNEDRAELGADHGIFKEDRIRHGSDRMILPTDRLDRRGWIFGGQGRSASLGVADERHGCAGTEAEAAQPPTVGVRMIVHVKTKAPNAPA